MTPIDIETIMQGVGFEEKEARVYRAALEMGEASVQEVAKHAGLKRTTAYYVLESLKRRGAVHLVRRGAREYVAAAEPRDVLRFVREGVDDFAAALPEVESLKLSRYAKPGVHFFSGPSGFKELWARILAMSPKEFQIITTAEHFIDFVPESYIIKEIIGTKRKKGIKSRQLITDTPAARKIVGKDIGENRASKFLSSRHTLPFTEIICDTSVGLISPRPDNLLMIIESESFAHTRRSMFNLLWEALP